MTTPHEKAIEAACRERCRREGTAQCAARCLEFFASSTTDGRCPHTVDVWGKHLTPAIAAYLASARESGCNIPKIEGEP